MALKKLFVFSYLGFLTLILSCGDPTSLKKRKRVIRDDWQVAGNITSADYKNGEVVALGMDGIRYRTRIASDNSFALELPGNAVYAVYFLAPLAMNNDTISSAQEFINGAQGPNIEQNKTALLYFEENTETGLRDTLRLPKVLFSRDVYLGEIDIKNDQAFSTVNPFLWLDFDADGVSDFVDRDDQNDGLNDFDQRHSLERVQICHMASVSKAQLHSIPLSHLFNHLSHGDSIGPCKAKIDP